MRSLLKLLTLPIALLCAAPAVAQTTESSPPTISAPTITTISPAYGGVGPNGSGTSSSGPWTITGTGFSMTQKATRFVDNNGGDIFSYASCSSTTTCTAYMRPDRVAAGSVATLTVYALVGGATSPGKSFLYYGALNVTSLVPSLLPSTGGSYAINGGPFTSNVTGYPGTTSVYLLTSIADYASGCTSIAQCNVSAVNLAGDCCWLYGARTVDIRTPGGYASPYLFYNTAPPTPTITSINPTSGPSAGGTQTVTITGTNFYPGTNFPSGGGFGATIGTTFTFNTGGSFPTSNPATSVNCSTTTTCTAVVPSGSAGIANVQVQYICPTSSTTCGTNARPTASLPTTKNGAYAYTGVKVTPGYGTTLYTSEDGQSASFTEALYSQPTANVHVALTLNPLSPNLRATLSTSGLDFTTSNWNTPQTVTVTGLNDTGSGGTPAPGTGNYGFSVGSVATSTDLNYNNVYGNDQQFTNVDNDSKQFFISPQGGLVTTRAGGTATFTVVLTAPPAFTVVVNLASNDPVEGTVSPISLTFSTAPGGATGWNVPRTVTVTGQNDGAAGQNKPYTILVTTSSSDASYGDPNVLYPPDVQVTNEDAPPAITVQPLSQTINSGLTANLSVTATGTPPLTYQWYTGSSGNTASPVGGATSNTFTTPALVTTTNYWVRVTNGAGTADSNTATITVNVPVVTPTNVTATATTATSVTVTWTTSGGTSYEVDRSSGGGFVSLGTTAAPPFIDNTASANTAYLYEVRVVAPSVTPFSAPDLATTVIFTNPVITAGTSPIMAVDFNQLRTAVNAVRALAGLGAWPFVDTLTAASTTVQLSHMQELRNAVDPARAALSLLPIPYIHAVLGATSTISAADINDLRNGVK